jgi:ribosomal protein S18 acetylase RimI-like enzyme
MGAFCCEAVDVAAIRPVESRDQAAIARLWQALSDYHARIDPRLPLAVPGADERYAERLIERRGDPGTRVFVAEVDGQVVGYILGAIIDLHPDLFQHTDAGFIADIFVDPAYRRRGIARELVETISAWFTEQGAQHIEWQVAAANTAGVRFWEAVGGLAIMVRMRLDTGEF